MKSEIRLCCENCHTIFSVKIPHVSIGESRPCPECGYRVAMDGDAVRRAARKVKAHLDLGSRDAGQAPPENRPPGES